MNRTSDRSSGISYQYRLRRKDTSSLIPHLSYLKRKTGRFSLIELLVVIAIIAILAAMLLPALNKARERARTIQCSSLFSNSGKCLALYSDDFKEYYPSNSVSMFRPTGRMAGYWPKEKGDVHYGGFGNGTTWKTSKYICPSAAQPNTDIDPAYWSDGYSFTQGYNNYFTDTYVNEDKNPSILKKSTWRYPSKLLIMGDASDCRITYFPFSSSDGKKRMRPRHSNGCNILFGDGHVTWMSKADIPDQARQSCYQKAFYHPQSSTSEWY